MFVFVFSLLLVHCVLGAPVDEQETIEYREWVPSRTAYARDFDRWFDWVPTWGGNDNKVRKPSVKERLETLETRQKVLFDLVRCESYGQTDCSPFRTQAETVFEVPAKEQQLLTAPTKVISPVTPTNSPTTLSPTTASPTASPTTASPTAPVVPVDNAATENTAAPEVSTAEASTQA